MNPVMGTQPRWRKYVSYMFPARGGDDYCTFGAAPTIGEVARYPVYKSGNKTGKLIASLRAYHYVPNCEFRGIGTGKKW